MVWCGYGYFYFAIRFLYDLVFSFRARPLRRRGPASPAPRARAVPYTPYSVYLASGPAHTRALAIGVLPRRIDPRTPRGRARLYPRAKKERKKKNALMQCNYGK